MKRFRYPGIEKNYRKIRPIIYNWKTAILAVDIELSLWPAPGLDAE